MDFTLTPDQEAIRQSVAAICARFDDAYWLEKDRHGGFPADFHAVGACASNNRQQRLLAAHGSHARIPVGRRNNNNRVFHGYSSATFFSSIRNTLIGTGSKEKAGMTNL